MGILRLLITSGVRASLLHPGPTDSPSLSSTRHLRLVYSCIISQVHYWHLSAWEGINDLNLVGLTKGFCCKSCTDLWCWVHVGIPVSFLLSALLVTFKGIQDFFLMRCFDIGLIHSHISEHCLFCIYSYCSGDHIAPTAYSWWHCGNLGSHMHKLLHVNVVQCLFITSGSCVLVLCIFLIPD